MSLYKFSEIYYRITGEYENEMQILFIHPDADDLLIHDLSCFILVNKPVHISLEGFTQYKLPKKDYCIQRLFSKGFSDYYVELENGFIHVYFEFSHRYGQKVTDLKLYSGEPLNNMENIKTEELLDFRFRLPAILF
ncbi:hypothetical protein HNQ91_000613 [Filimonas zeae]|uniref:Uncharacterized protein n=1 Tax=Filimonas zeae TaxID=1737353 RepID=A0A917IR12_9BACT|nr:hypothetical protein [Filimonas zeae]GGH59355.1 hypothetical protein GCM10011379_06030 [Filimonas zeae]